MNRITFFPLAPFRLKYLGLALAVVGLVLTLFLAPDYENLVYPGLFFMVFSRERVENEETQMIRNELYKSVFGLLMAVVIALYLTQLISGDFLVKFTPFTAAGAPMILYLILFYLTSLLRIRVGGSQDVAGNIRLHRRFYLVWLSITFLLAVILVLRITDLI